jgi:hypothetical protein
LVEVSDVWIDQARFVEMLNQTLNSVTPEEARKAAGNNRGYLHSMLLQMQRLQLTDSHLDTLQEVAIDDEQSVDSHPDDNEGLQSQDSSSLLDVGAFLAVNNARGSQASVHSSLSSSSLRARPHVFNLV